ncbi:hypothetical protein ABW19_dt0203278 [Dactylella cylindrospora]|nr:hypothetical protein ABW19_dt0203278 [Dactylella cylindrospora]
MSLILKGINSVVEGLSSIIEGGAMPFNGDKEDLGEKSRPVAQSDSRMVNSSPLRKSGRAGSSASYSSGYKGHKSGNPPIAKKIQILGGFQPRNNINEDRHSGTTQQKPSNPSTKRRPGQGQGKVLYAAEAARRNVANFGPGLVESGIDPSTSDDKPSAVESPTRSKPRSDRRGTSSKEPVHLNVSPKRHRLLSPQQFTPGGDKSRDGSYGEDREISGSPPQIRKSANVATAELPENIPELRAEPEESWNIPSSHDPSKTKFTSRKRSSDSDALTSGGQNPGARQKKSNTSITLKQAWRGPIRISEFNMLIKREEDGILQVYVKAERKAEFRIDVGNVQLVTVLFPSVSTSYYDLRTNNA